MSDRTRFLLLIMIMSAICVSVTGISLWILYGTAIDEERERLTETAQSQARLIESIARFDGVYSKDYPLGPVEATISQIRDAHNNYKGFGETGEFTLAYREGDNIVFLLRHRHYDLDVLKPVNIDSKFAEPMKLALSGNSGTVIGLDYRGKEVLAAYEPVKSLDLGIVAKLDMDEIRAPFVRAAIIVFGVMLAFVLLGAALFLKISNPVIRRLEEYNKKLHESNQKLIEEIEARKLTEQRTEHLNRVLRSIRDVNQMIVRERDIDKLINEGCRLLVDNRGYESALIILADDGDKPVSWAASGIAASTETLNTLLENHELPPCCKIQSDNKIMVIDDRHDFCVKCPIAEGCAQTHSLYIQLTHGDKFFGHLIAALDQSMSTDEEECSLFTEMAGDIAYALNFQRMEEAHDSSKRKRESLEMQLFQAQKMESVGRLAGGVAHDFNNMLSVIIGNAELALDQIDSENSLHGDIEEILKAANRSTEITRQLLGFARQQTISPKLLDLNEVVENQLKMLRRLIGEDIDLAWLPAKKVPPVKIDPIQVDQIMANLCVNARDAIGGVGKITIETDNTSFDNAYCADHAGFIPGEYVCLAISDDGSGIPPGTLEKIFDPFFTTKKMGQGTGLGLSTVYGIIKQNNGFINIYSEPSEGTTLKIYFPTAAGETVKSFTEVNVELPLSRGETVLLVEDETAILKLSKKMLENLGYIVLDAPSPDHAIKLAEKFEDEIHILITDVVMPEMNGRDLATQLKNFYPDMKIIFMSGYTANTIAHRGVLEDGVNFLPKPFNKNALAHKIREVLDGEL